MLLVGYVLWGGGCWERRNSWASDEIVYILSSRHITGQHEKYVVGPKVSGLTYKSRAKRKMLWGVYSAIYGEVNVSVEKCAEIKGGYVEK